MRFKKNYREKYYSWLISEFKKRTVQDYKRKKNTINGMALRQKKNGIFQ